MSINVIMTENHWTVQSCRVTCKLQRWESALKFRKEWGKNNFWFGCLSQVTTAAALLLMAARCWLQENCIDVRWTILSLRPWNTKSIYFSQCFGASVSASSNVAFVGNFESIFSTEDMMRRRRNLIWGVFAWLTCASANHNQLQPDSFSFDQTRAGS